MIESIGKIEPPDWLMSEELVFDPLEVIKDSLFYPRSELDTYPITLFYENVYSYIYADFGLFSRPYEVFNDYEFIDFKIIHKEIIYPDRFNTLDVDDNYLFLESMRDNGDFNYLFDLMFHPFKYEEEFKSVFTDMEKSFPFYCEWIIYQNSSGKRFSLLYFRAEAMSVYFTLYIMNRAAPKIVVILNPDSGPYCWTDFGDEKGFFAQLILGQKYETEEIAVPEYLLLSLDIVPWFSHPYLVYRDRIYFGVYRIKVTSLSTILNRLKDTS